MSLSRRTMLVWAFSAASFCASGQLLADIVDYTVTGELSGGGIVSGSLAGC